MKRVYFIFCVCIYALLCNSISAQEATHVFTAKKTASKVSFAQVLDNFRKDFSLAPHYSAGLGAGLAFSYTPSGKRVSVIGNIASTGYALLGVQGKHPLKGGKWEFNHNSYYCFSPVHYWGTGYLNGSDNSNKVTYDKKYLNLRGEFLYHSGHLYLGPSFGYENIAWDKIESASYYNLGFTVGYDSRNSAAAPSKGVKTIVSQRYAIGEFGTTSFTFDTYFGVWDGGILALDLYSEFAYSQVPWYAMPTIGGSYRMRGYHIGRYRDNNMVTAQIELRQRVVDPFRAAVWVGAGNVWGRGGAFSVKHTLPNYGIGVRVKVGGSRTLRFDWGFGEKGQNGFILGMNEAF